MKFKVDANVLTATGEKIGEVERVVIDPKTKEITHVVVRKGFLFTEDKVVPVDLIAAAMEEDVRLRPDAGDLEALPDYVEEHYILVDERDLGRPDVPAPTYWYPPFGAAMVAEPAATRSAEREALIQQKEYNIPKGTVAMEEGAKVMAADHEHVGDVEEVLTDPQADRVTHFVITEGLLFKDRKLIPFHWVNQIMPDKVQLAVGSSFLERLPEYQN
jgi:uncharacterized protein YrrD